MAKLLSKFFRVAVEGDTIDGRDITSEMISDMAETYDPKRYGARVWTEHFRGFIPGGPFDALGDVVALKAEAVSDGGELDGKLGLYARLAPLPALVAMNKSGQKVYSSIESMTNFANSGKAYLVGLACTDTPSSQGTEMLAFSHAGSEAFAGPSQEVQMEFYDPGTEEDEEKPSLFSRVQGLLQRKGKKDAACFSDLDSAITAVAESQQGSLETIEQMESQQEDASGKFAALKQAHDDLLGKFTALLTQLENAPGFSHTPRVPASGGPGDKITDC